MIQTQHLTKRFRAVTAVDDLSITARDGRVTGFVGPNGSGKTSTMRMVVGLDRPTSGAALVDGRPLRDHPAPQRVVGAVLDSGGAPDGMTVRAHLRWLAAAGRIPLARADHVLEEVGLGPVLPRRIGALSLGMRQRLGIAAALLGDPGTVILDEPVNGLDPDGVRWVRHLMRRLAAEGRCVLVSSHLMAEMQQTADSVVVIGAGRLLGQLDISGLPEGTSLEEAYLSLTAGALQYRAGSREGNGS
jgi:ABC-2 type transport system ATP-binding protein